MGQSLKGLPWWLVPLAVAIRSLCLQRASPTDELSWGPGAEPPRPAGLRLDGRAEGQAQAWCTRAIGARGRGSPGCGCVFATGTTCWSGPPGEKTFSHANV